MTVDEIKRNYEISKEHIERMEAAGLTGHILSTQRDYVEQTGILLTEIERLNDKLQDAYYEMMGEDL